MTSMRSITFAVFFLILLGVSILVSVPALAVQVGNDVVNFIAVRYDYPNPGESTWYYQVISGAQPEISHVVFQANLECLEILDAGTWDGSDFDSLNSGDGDPEEVDPNPTTGVTGLKFDEGFSAGETRYYYLTVDGNYAEDQITVATKAGPGFDTALITGPSLECITVTALQGCTPGFWKNHLGSWLPTGLDPDDTVESVFVEAAAYQISGSKLLEALRFHGGPGAEGAARILLRAAMAALLNAKHPDVSYAISDSDVISDVNDALASGDRQEMLGLAELLDDYNNSGCPLGGPKVEGDPQAGADDNKGSKGNGGSKRKGPKRSPAQRTTLTTLWGKLKTR